MDREPSTRFPASSCLQDETLALYAAAALSEAATEGVKAHIDGCAPCRRLLVAVAATDAHRSGEAVAVTSIHEHAAELRRGRLSSGAAALGPFRAGDVIADRYHVERGLGAGGMGRVLLARDATLNRRVAIKVLHEDLQRDGTAVVRFAREARATAQLTGPHVPHIYEVGTLATSAPFIAMEYLEGIDLGALLKEQGPLSIERGVRYVREACEALAEAHRLGIIHRDVKPRNLFLAATAGKSIVKVLDFGIAKVRETGHDDAALTGTGAVLGTPQFLSPEQIEATREVDARTDIWSLGATLFCLLTGRPPFDAPNAKLMIAKVLLEEAPRLRAARADAPLAVEAVIARCLARDPADRFQTADALRDALQGAGTADGAGSVTLRSGDSPVTEAPRAASPRSSAVVPWAIAGAAVAALAFVVHRAPEVPRPAAVAAPLEQTSPSDAAPEVAPIVVRVDASPEAASPSSFSVPAEARSRCTCRAGRRTLCRRDDLERPACECHTRDGTRLFWLRTTDGGEVRTGTLYSVDDSSVGSATGRLCSGFFAITGPGGTRSTSSAKDGSFTACRRACAAPTSFAGVPGAVCQGIDDVEQEAAGLLSCP